MCIISGIVDPVEEISDSSWVFGILWQYIYIRRICLNATNLDRFSQIVVGLDSVYANVVTIA